jgi:hypothetical protein
MGRPFIYGPTSHAERTRVLHAFKNDPNVNTIFLSKVRMMWVAGGGGREEDTVPTRQQ